MPVTEAEKAVWAAEKTMRGLARWEHELAVRHHLSIRHLAVELMGNVSSWPIRQLELRNIFWRGGEAAEPMWREFEEHAKDKTKRMAIGPDTLRLIYRLAEAKAKKASVPLTAKIVASTIQNYKRKKNKKGVRAARGMRTHRTASRFEQARQEAAKLLEGVDPERAAQIKREFNAALDIAWHTVLNGVEREAHVNRLDVVLLLPRRKNLVQACHTLMLDPPRTGQIIDPVKVKRQRFTLLKHYHPDANSAPDAEENYKTVQAAVQIVEMYNAVLSRKVAS